MEDKIYRFSKDSGQLMRRIHELMKDHKSFEIYDPYVNKVFCTIVSHHNYYFFRRENVTIACDRITGNKYSGEYDDHYLKLDLYNNHTNIARAFIWWSYLSVRIISS